MLADTKISTKLCYLFNTIYMKNNILQTNITDEKLLYIESIQNLGC